MNEELLACIKDENIEALETGQLSKSVFPYPRREAHEKGISHLIVRVFIMALTAKDEPLFLVQKRNEKKKSYPNYYTDSASGHVIYRENLSFEDIKKDALRELEEEMGISSKFIQFLNFERIQREKDSFTGEVAYIFFGLVDSEIELSPDQEEVDTQASKFYTKKELHAILSQEQLVDYSREVWQDLIDLDIRSYFGGMKDNNGDTKAIIGLFIGRFQPLHHGHVHVINAMRKNCQFLKIGIGSAQLSHEKDNPFTAKERREFIQAVLEKRNVLPKQYAIYEIPDIFNASKWVKHVATIAGEFNLVFSNSDWVRNLFQKEGYQLAKKYVVFKKKYNGSHIRDLIEEDDQIYRNLVPNEVIKLMKKFDGIERIKSLEKK